MKTFRLIYLFISASLLASCNKTSTDTFYKDNKINISLNEISSFNFHSDLQQSYMDGYYTTYDLYVNANEELSKSNGLDISFNVESKYTDLSYEFIYSNDESFTDSIVEYLDTPSVTLYNFLLDSTYYYQLKVLRKNKLITTLKSSFKITTDKLRNLYFPNISNFRDIGGYETINNKKVKQGMIYRCGRLNESNTSEYKLEVNDVDLKLLKNLKIRSEVDLRNDGFERGMQEKSPLADVLYYQYPMVYSGNILLMNKDILPELIKLLANKDNYPMMIHCDKGTDRTGMVCFLIECLLGMDLKDIYRDYLFSNYSKLGSVRSESTIDSYLRIIGTYSSSDLQEKTTNYLIKNGVLIEDINNLKDILLIS